MSTMSSWGQYLWNGRPPVYGGDVFALGRRLASHGLTRDQIAAALGQSPVVAGQVRTQEIGRAARYGWLWNLNVGIWFDNPASGPMQRDRHLHQDQLPTNYRYVVDVHVDAAAGEWRTVVVDSADRLSPAQIRSAAANVYAQISQRYISFALYNVNEDTPMRLSGAFQP